ncbi:MAG: 3-hydroxyacyl-ACP dehydratase FabZ family protein [Planctomycetota bacterium]
MKEALVDFSKFDVNTIIEDLDEVLKVNPHRFELRLLDGILYSDELHAVGYKDLSDEEFWIRGHFPERPLMPGVLICECAAQLSSYYAITAKLVDNGYVGLGGLDDVRFRGPVVPGDKLVVMLRRGKVRRNRMFSADFQGFVDQNLVVSGVIKGVALGE